MSVSNLSDFSDSQFNAYDWINSSMEMMGNNEDMDSFLSGLSMKIQILAQDCGDTIESEMVSLLDKLPNMMTQIGTLGKELDGLKKDIKEMTNETKVMEKNSESDLLANLKGIQTNMKICKSQLETILEWDQLCASCQESLSSEDTEMAASVLEDMTKSVALLSGLPDQESRLHTLQQYKTELENQLSPKLDSCLQINSDDQLLSLYKIYCSLHIEQSFVQKYCTHHASSFKEYIIWAMSQVESPIDTLQNFYTNLHTTLLTLNDSILAVFSDSDEDVLLQLIECGCELISPEFLSHLSRLPVNRYSHCLNTSYSYMEIIAGCITNPQKKECCLNYLLKDWFEYTTKYFIENEYNTINSLVNQISKQTNEENLISTFFSAVQSVFPSFFLSLSNFQDHCFSLGHGILLPGYLNSLNSLFTNLHSLFSAMLERYILLTKSSSTPQSLLQNNVSLSGFNWSLFQDFLSLVLVIDQLTHLLRRTSNQTIQFLQDHQELLLSSSSPAGLTCESLFLSKQGCDPSWQASIHSLLSSISTLPSTVLLSSLQSSYLSMTSILNKYIDQTVSLLVLPVQSIFHSMVNLPCWSSVDSSVHCLPSDPLLPIGEYMLKVVEQLEIASSSVSELFVTIQDDQEVHEVILEMEKYGVQKERGILEQCNLILKHGVCYGLNEEGETLQFSQGFMFLIARLTMASYLESLLSISHIKLSGSQQLAVDAGYLLNVISAFDIGKAKLIVALKEALSLSDPELSQRLSSYTNTNEDEAVVVQRIAKIRGVLAC